MGHVLMQRSSAAWCAVALIGMITTASSGAELRTTVGKKTIHRQIAYETPSEEEVLIPEGTLLADQHASACGGCTSCSGGGSCLSCWAPCGIWGEAEYLIWWRRGRRMPPLVTSSPDGTPLSQAGVLGLSGTQVLFGDGTVGSEARAGGRVTIGAWLDPSFCHSIEGRFFSLGDDTISAEFASEGSPILTRPFDNRDPLLGPVGPLTRVLAFPGIANAGRVDITSQSEVLGGDLLWRYLVCSTGCLQIDLLAGYQYARIDEDLVISDSFVDIDPSNPILDGTRQDVVDQFATRNKYHAGQFGFEGTYYGSCWRLELLAKIGFGNMRQEVTIAGTTTNDVIGDPDSPVTVAGGLLANSANSGRHVRDDFAVAPELGATFVYQMHECVDVSVGYSFIYYSSVVQPGEQIHQQLFVPGDFSFADTSFWLHGLNLGAQVRF